MLSPAHFLNSTHPLRLYGTTPPRLNTSPEDIESAAQKLAERTRSLPLDGIIVYDVQDESGRTSEPRPFPFLPTLDSRMYSQLLHKLSGTPVITYKSIGGMDETRWQNWLDQTQSEFDVSTLSLVGSPTRQAGLRGLSLLEAIEQANSHPGHFALGGVAIAERHVGGRSESARMIQKACAGCDFFVSQSVYNAQKTIQLLNDYSKECSEQGLAPKRCVLTFAPCGRAKTLEFIKWLGVSIPEDTERSILEAADPLHQSIEICRSLLSEILDKMEDSTLQLGLNVESVSNKKDEIDASVELFHVLDEVLTSWQPRAGAPKA